VKHKIRVSVPDDAPPVLRASSAWTDLAMRAEIDYHETLPGPALVERIGGAEAVLNIRSSSKFTAEVFAALPTLRLLSIWGTGTDHVDLEAAARYCVTVTNTPGVSAVSIAEHTLALLFAVARRIPQVDASTRRGEWLRGQSMELRGKTCGVIGLGAIGREFARLAAAIGMRVIAWTMHARHIPGVEMVEIDHLYRSSDIVSLHLRLSPETAGFLGRRELALLKPTAILLNTARGGLIDEPALTQALATNRLAGAGLDVFAQEPLPTGHPLTALPNVVLTPHCAGITPEALEAGLRMAVENIWRFAEGLPEHVV
jgi:D-3-phosphoglycerate dehydrogenase / 2-oxoglutarate reductase